MMARTQDVIISSADDESLSHFKIREAEGIVVHHEDATKQRKIPTRLDGASIAALRATNLSRSGFSLAQTVDLAQILTVVLWRARHSKAAKHLVARPKSRAVATARRSRMWRRPVIPPHRENTRRASWRRSSKLSERHRTIKLASGFSSTMGQHDSATALSTCTRDSVELGKGQRKVPQVEQMANEKHDFVSMYSIDI